MRIFIYEYLTGGGWFEQSNLPPAGSLLDEGAEMIRAVSTDLVELGHAVTLLRDARLPQLQLPAQPTIVGSAAEERVAFDQACRSSEAAILIAPEFDGILQQRCRWATASGVALFSPSEDFIAAAGDKWITAQRFAAAGVASPPTQLLSRFCNTMSPPATPCIVKPRDGAGSEGVELLPHAAAWERFVAALPPEARHQWLVQTYCPGIAASIAVLCGPGVPPLFLPAMQQLLQPNFRYEGAEGPLASELQLRAERLARAALLALPPCSGYVGIDLVLGDDPEGKNDYAIEVNPRLTTSYAALRQLVNVAACMMGTAQGRSVSLSFEGIKAAYRVGRSG